MEKYQDNIVAFKKLEKPKAIIFDWDNTLANTWPLITHSIDETMIYMGKEPWGEEKVKGNVHKSMRESFPEIFGDEWERAGDFYRNHYRSIHLGIQLINGAKEMIESIYSQGIMQFVVSNKIGATLRKEAKEVGVDDKFFSLIGASDANFDKPATNPVELAVMGSGIDLKKDEVWFVGDTLTDVECAFNCQVTPVIYCCGGDISPTISEKIYQNGRNNSGYIACFFDFKELVEKLSR
ncbi:MAG: HAD-IA family hydrolase [Rickettsiales bacterium]|nr:HAD-IA family hydrolase [Rickettsiales bacterium]